MEVEHAKAKNGFYLLTKSAINALTCLYSRLLVWYNRHTTEGLEVCCVESKQVPDVNMRAFDFMFYRIAMPKACMAAWIYVPEFARKISSLMSDGVDINNEVVLKVADGILRERSSRRRVHDGIRMAALRRGINHLRRAVEASGNEC